MNEILPILAQSLAPDNVWFALLLVVVLALLAAQPQLSEGPPGRTAARAAPPARNRP